MMNAVLEEVDLFVGKDFIITFHFHRSDGIEKVRRQLSENSELWKKGPSHIAYMVMDQLVDEYFPILYKIEDRLNEIAESLFSTTRCFPKAVFLLFQYRLNDESEM